MYFLARVFPMCAPLFQNNCMWIQILFFARRRVLLWEMLCYCVFKINIKPFIKCDQTYFHYDGVLTSLCSDVDDKTTSYVLCISNNPNWTIVELPPPPPPQRCSTYLPFRQKPSYTYHANDLNSSRKLPPVRCGISFSFISFILYISVDTFYNIVTKHSI